MCCNARADSTGKIDDAYLVIRHARFAMVNRIRNVSPAPSEATLITTRAYLVLRSARLALDPILHSVSLVHQVSCMQYFVYFILLSLFYKPTSYRK